VPIPVAVRFKAYLCGRSVAGITVSNPAACMECSSLVFVVFCVCSELCDGLSSLSDEFYRVHVSRGQSF
jgi:DNA-directed RNA polymerase subunit RPC12/RpoP